eukprot:TRINITY_DN11089_c0_g1_i1.p1 TRINITY_DN11089_c0_g1~~TRINITY_DN11089_c0_g1_i1.p1  ORF type:complete len:127 (+),score=35.42 TRINITY_DN11089_c0_g1_i1:316-696(+)
MASATYHGCTRCHNVCQQSMAMGWYERVVSMNGELSGKARNDRKLMLIFSATSAFLPPLFLSTSVTQPAVLLLFNLTAVGGSLPVVFLLLTCNHLSRRVMQAYVYMMAVSTLLIDFQQRTLMYPAM